MTTLTAELGPLDSWVLEWDKSDAKAEDLLQRFQDKLAEQSPDLLSDILSAADGDRACLRGPTGEEATAIFDTLLEAGRSEDLTFKEMRTVPHNVGTAQDRRTLGIILQEALDNDNERCRYYDSYWHDNHMARLGHGAVRKHPGAASPGGMGTMGAGGRCMRQHDLGEGESDDPSRRAAFLLPLPGVHRGHSPAHEAEEAAPEARPGTLRVVRTAGRTQ